MFRYSPLKALKDSLYRSSSVQMSGPAHSEAPRKKKGGKIAFIPYLVGAIPGIAHGIWRIYELAKAEFLISEFERVEPYLARLCSDFAAYSGMLPSLRRYYDTAVANALWGGFKPYFQAYITRVEFWNPLATSANLFNSIHMSFVLILAGIGVVKLWKSGYRVVKVKK